VSSRCQIALYIAVAKCLEGDGRLKIAEIRLLEATRALN